MRASFGAPLALALAFAAWGCAELPPIEPGAVPRAGTAPPAPAPVARPIGANSDSLPSADALAVLASIPEPLAADSGAPAPAGRGVRSEPPATRVDSSAARPSSPTSAEADSSAPVPSPTVPLGSGPQSTTAPPPELPALPLAPPPMTPHPPPAATPPDTCWRVQVGAPLDRTKGKQLRDASESLLIVPMIVDRESGHWKVRTRDCLPRETAENLRARAVASGFKGVFLVRTVGPHR
jgi:hypothetical protein